MRGAKHDTELQDWYELWHSSPVAKTQTHDKSACCLRCSRWWHAEPSRWQTADVFWQDHDTLEEAQRAGVGFHSGHLAPVSRRIRRHSATAAAAAAVLIRHRLRTLLIHSRAMENE